MVIGKISSFATTIIIFALAFIFLKQAYSTSIGRAGQDVGLGLSSTASGISSVINSFISPITGIFGTISGFFNMFGNNSNNEGGRATPTPTGRDERGTPTNRVKTGDTISWSSGVSRTIAGGLSPAAKSHYASLGVKVS